MTVKRILKKFIPPIIFEIKDIILSNQAIKESPLKKINRNTDKIIILGNGPSLKDTIDKYLSTIISYDRIAVNYMGASDMFELLKPNFYVFADPAFFFTPSNETNSMNNLFECIVKKTNWPMQVIIPSNARGSAMEEYLTRNHNISILHYCNIPQNIGRLSKFEAWDNNLIPPPAQNVLNACIYFALYWGYPETYIVGADSSFIEDLRIDQDTNTLYTIDTHFYNKDKVYSLKDKGLFDQKKGRIKKNRTVGQILNLYSKMFLFYEELQQYSEYKHLNIYNASEYSWIDAFKRKKLDSI